LGSGTATSSRGVPNRTGRWSHRIDQEAFWGRQRFADFDGAAAGLRAWETHHNQERFSLALQGRTPAEKLAALMPAVAV